MLKYIAKTEINGIEIRLIQSQFAFAVIYGMEKKSYQNQAQAWRGYKNCVIHAASL